MQAQKDSNVVNIAKIMNSIAIVTVMYTVMFVYNVYAVISNFKFCFRWETLQETYGFNFVHACILAIPYLVMIILKTPKSMDVKGSRKCEGLCRKLFKSEGRGTGDIHTSTSGFYIVKFDSF